MLKEINKCKRIGTIRNGRMRIDMQQDRSSATKGRWMIAEDRVAELKVAFGKTPQVEEGVLKNE